MDLSAISQIVGSLGFPIAVAIACFWYINKQEEQHKLEIDKMAEAVNNNTEVLRDMVQHCRKDDEDGK